MMLTVFTPTYNRAEFLPNVFDSLLKQKSYNFEWLVVDDGSSDDTETVINELKKDSPFSVVYLAKGNGGKHSAHNAAVEQARGEWFLCLDSDDLLAEDAIALIEEGLSQLCASDCGLIAHKQEQGGALLSSPLRSPENHVGIYSTLSAVSGGEYAFVFRTEVLKEFPYPIVAEERFMGECVLYDRLELVGYTVCPLPEVLQICEYQPDGLSSNTYRLMAKNPAGYQIYHAQRIDLARSLRERLGHCIRYQAFYTMSKNKEYRYRGRHRLLTALMYLPGRLGAYYYRNKAESI